LQWLQPTPEISTPAALYLPPLWRQMRSDGEARSGASSQPSGSFLCEVLSDESTSVSEHGDVLQEQCWADMSMDPVSPMENITSAPQLTPCISSLPTPPPPPPYMPSEMPSSPLALQTPSPTWAYATSMPLPQSRARALQTREQPAPTLLATSGSFAALNAWSATCDDLSRQATDEPRMSGLAQVCEEPEETTVAEFSIGSALHDLGTCKPCAFVHRPTGCADGSACKFCHLCTPGERKRRQKLKFERMHQRRLRKAATSATSVDSMGDCCTLASGTPAPR